ncbi:MAG TPA: hypothetical protein PLX89_02740 [Verrucomicrobiota bacterium]|nr:hypothetical protein [Verrucomicrobiota bacterium]
MRLLGSRDDHWDHRPSNALDGCAVVTQGDRVEEKTQLQYGTAKPDEGVRQVKAVGPLPYQLLRKYVPLLWSAPSKRSDDSALAAGQP